MSTTRKPTQAEASRLALAAARSTLNTRRTDHAAAVAALAELTDRLDCGDDTVSVSDLGTARDAEDRAARLLSAAESAAAKAERALVNDETDLGDLFAELFHDMFDGLVPIKVVTLPEDVAPNTTGKPVLFIAQTKASTNHGGSLAGDLVVTYYRGPLLAPLDGCLIADLCKGRGHDVDVLGSVGTNRSDHLADELRIRVRSAFPSIPTLSTAPDDEAVLYFVRGVAHRMLAAVVHNGHIPRPSFSGDVVSNGGSVLVGHRATGKETTKDGTTRHTIELDLELTESPFLGPHDRVHPRIVAAVGDVIGQAEQSVGRTVAAEMVRCESPEITPHRAASPWKVTVRVVQHYRVTG